MTKKKTFDSTDCWTYDLLCKSTKIETTFIQPVLLDEVAGANCQGGHAIDMN
jgi:hypothetical protein